MKVLDLNKKVSDSIFQTVQMYGDNGEIVGYFTTLAEARKVALDSKERYFNNDEFYIYEMPWSDTEGEYVNIYDKNGGLLDAIEVV